MLLGLLLEKRGLLLEKRGLLLGSGWEAVRPPARFPLVRPLACPSALLAGRTAPPLSAISPSSSSLPPLPSPVPLPPSPPFPPFPPFLSLADCSDRQGLKRGLTGPALLIFFRLNKNLSRQRGYEQRDLNIERFSFKKQTAS